MFLHWPLVRSMVRIATCYIALALFNVFVIGEHLGTFLSWVFGTSMGLVYFHFFEYLWHRVPMHNKFRLIPFLYKSHMKHHAVFRQDFQRNDPEALENILGEWFVFPSLLFIHYGLLLLVPALHVYLPAFFLGIALHFALFETCHWFTHIPDNGFDNFLKDISVIGPWRARQIEYHRLHHEEITCNYQFTPSILETFFNTMCR